MPVIEGLDQLKHLIDSARRGLKKAVKRELLRHAEEVMTESKQRVPVKTGALMNTGKVMPPVETGTTVQVDLGYGDESVDYALIVHEEVNAPSGAAINWTRPGSGPKYLQGPFDEKADELMPRIATAVQNLFKK